jgi:hypothetical protein
VCGTELHQFPDQGQKDLVEAREAHIGLELDAGGAQHPDSGDHRHLVRRIQQSRLAYTRITGHQQRCAPDGHLVEEGPDDPEIPVTSS